MIRKTEFLKYAELLAMGLALEVSAYPKPGNVHRLRDFADTIYEDFIVTAIVAVKPLYRAILRGYRYGEKLRDLDVVYGDIIYEIVAESKDVSGGGNTCLGTSILLTPIAISIGVLLNIKNDTDINEVLNAIPKQLEEFSTPLDTVHLYNSIRIANPSYIRESDETGVYPNVWDKNYREKIIERGIRLWEILRFSSSYDLVANEIINGYPRVRDVVEQISYRLKLYSSWNRAIVESYLYLLSKDLDTLVIRKNGVEIARYVRDEADRILKICEESWSRCLEELWKFDNELATKKVNPGSTADIIATAISVYTFKKKKMILRST